jgi:hypothetical protein
MTQSLLDSIPSYILDISIFLILLLFVEIGYLIGKYKRSTNDKEAGKAIGPAAASILGLLAFLIAFAFNMAAGKFDTRKQNVLLEANAIGTAYLRADFLKDPYKSRIKDLLRVYVDNRLEILTNVTDKDTKYLAKSLEIHDHLWEEALLASEDANNATIALMAESLNELFDIHSNRVAASVYNRFAWNIWLMLFAVGALGMLMVGIQNGLSGPKRYFGIIPLVLAFTISFALIEDLDSPQRGMFKVGHQSIIDVKNSIAK